MNINNGNNTSYNDSIENNPVKFGKFMKHIKELVSSFTNTYKGKPVISKEIFLEKSRNDPSFGFKGYVSEDDNIDFYIDTYIINNILKDEETDGITISTIGLEDENKLMIGDENPDEKIINYEISVKIPSSIQKKNDIICIEDRCFGFDEYLESRESTDENEDRMQSIEEELRDIQSTSGSIIIRTGLNPQKDPKAREKVIKINEKIIKHINSNGNFEEIPELVNNTIDNFEK